MPDALEAFRDWYSKEPRYAEPNPADTKLLEDKSDDLSDIIYRPIPHGRRGPLIILPEEPLIDRYAEKLYEWNKNYGVRPSMNDDELVRRNRYLLEQAVRPDQPEIYAIRQLATPAGSEDEAGKQLIDDFKSKFPIRGDPERFGIFQSRWDRQHLKERFDKLDELRFLVNAQTPTFSEKKGAFEDALGDWLQAEHYRLGPSNFPAPAPQHQPVLRTTPEQTFDQYVRWLGHGGLDHPVMPERSEFGTPNPTDFLSEDEKKGFRDLDAENFFRYYTRKEQFYVSRRRLEQLTKTPYNRGARVRIASQLPNDQRDRTSTYPDKPDFQASDLAPISPFAMWVTQIQKNIRQAAKESLAAREAEPWYRKYDFISQMFEHYDKNRPPPLINDYIGEAAIPVGTGLAALGASIATANPIPLGVWGAFMLGLFDDVPDAFKELTATAVNEGAGYLGLKHYLRSVNNGREVSFKDVDFAARFPARYLKSLVGTPTLETATGKQIFDWVAQHYGVNDKEEMARVLDKAVPASTYLSSIGDRVSQYLLKHKYSLGPLSAGPALTASVFGNQKFLDSVSHFIGEPIDDLTVAALYFGLFPRAFDKLGSLSGFEGGPRHPVLSQLEKRSLGPQPKDGYYLLDASMREHSFNNILNAFKRARNHPEAREILTRIEDEARLRGPLDPTFEAASVAAFDALAASERKVGASSRKFSPEFFKAVSDLGGHVAGLGATEALYAAEQRIGRFNPAESGRVAEHLVRLIDALGDTYTPPLEMTPQGPRLKGSAGRFLSLTELKNNVATLLDVRNRQREVLGKRTTALDLFDSVIKDVEAEIKPARQAAEAAGQAVPTLIQMQREIIADALNILIDADAGRHVKRKPNPLYGTPFYWDIQRMKRYGEDRNWAGMPGHLILELGGRELYEAVEKDPANKVQLLKDAADLYLRQAHGTIDEPVPARPGGPRSELYAAIDRLLYGPDEVIKLSKEHLDALNEHLEIPLDFSDFEPVIKNYEDVRKANEARLQLLLGEEGKPGILEQLRAARKGFDDLWRQPNPDYKLNDTWRVSRRMERLGRDPNEYPYNPEAKPALRGVTFALQKGKPVVAISEALDKFLEKHLSDPLRKIKDDVFKPLTTVDIDRDSYAAWQELKTNLYRDADILSGPEKLLAHARKNGWSDAKYERALLEKAAAQLGYLDHLVMLDMARPRKGEPIGNIARKRWRNALDAYVSAQAREAYDLEIGQRRTTSRLLKFLQRPGQFLLTKTRSPADAMKIMHQMRTGRFTDPVAKEMIRRTLFELNASAFLAGRISEQDFVRYYGNDAYYRGSFGDKPYRFTGGRPYPVPGRFNLLKEHPSEYKFAIPEEGWYVVWKKTQRHEPQYKDGFNSLQEARDWAKKNLAEGTFVGLHRAWTLPMKMAAGLIFEPAHSISNLARSIAVNNHAAILGEALRPSRFVISARRASKEIPAENFIRDEKGKPSSFRDADGFYWVKQTDPNVAYLGDHYIHEHAVQWLGIQHPNMTFIHAMLDNLQRATGVNMVDKNVHLPDQLSWKNPLIDFQERLWNRVVGRPFPRTGAVVEGIGNFLGRSLTWSKVLLSPSSWVKQWTSNILFNMPAMGVNPMHPKNWPAVSRYFLAGLTHYFTQKTPYGDWAWDALFKNGNIEFTGGSYARIWHRIFKRNWESLAYGPRKKDEADVALGRAPSREPYGDSYEVRLDEARTALGNAATPRERTIIADHIARLEGEVREKMNAKGGLWHDLGSKILKVIGDAYQDVLGKGEGPATDTMFVAFGLADQLSKYAALRFLVEKEGMSVKGALSRIDTFGQNLHRTPAAIKGLATRLGGTKFTTYPFNQLAVMGNIFRHQPYWAAQMFATLYGYNNMVRITRGDNSDELENLYSMKNWGSQPTALTNMMYHMGRVELPSGGYHELDSLWGVFNGMSPVARATNEVIGNSKAPTSAKIGLEALTGMASHFGLGSVPLSILTSLTSHRDPYGEPLNSPVDVLRAFFKNVMQPDISWPWGRDYEFMFRGPAVDPLTNRPRESGQYWARRFLNVHPTQEMNSEQRVRVAMDAVLKSDGASGRFYGELTYQDLLEVKARARGGPIHADGTVDRPALRKLIQEHYTHEPVERYLPGLGDVEIPDTKNAREVEKALSEVTLPRLMRTWNHMNPAQQMDAYAIWRHMDSKPDADTKRAFEESLGRKILNRRPSFDVLERMRERVLYWTERKDQIPPDALTNLQRWYTLSLPVTK